MSILAPVLTLVNGWPEWALWSLAILGVISLILSIVPSRLETAEHTAKKNAAELDPKFSRRRPAFYRFQAQYLSVYLLVMLADWLQGTNMYTLYQSYGVDVGLLFLTGFSSGAIFGTCLGLYVDRFGRKNGCIIFCVLELIINTLEHYNSLPLLMIGRILGGVSTSLLFSTFESWMVSAHRSKKFPEEWLPETFSYAAMGNGVMAVMAGIIAQVASDILGDIGPFQVALALTAMALVLILFWKETYSREHGLPAAPLSKPGHAEMLAQRIGLTKTDSISSIPSFPPVPEAISTVSSMAAPPVDTSISAAWAAVRNSRSIQLLGLCQSLFEGAMYTFVFMWVPTLQTMLKPEPLPTGLVFSNFMMCITMGGLIFRVCTCGPLGAKFSVEAVTVGLFAISTATMLMSATVHSFMVIFVSFLIFEVCVGAFFACSATLRSKLLPDALQSSIMNIFRVPLNILVVTGTKLTDWYPPGTVFLVCAAWLAIGTLLQQALAKAAAKTKKLA